MQLPAICESCSTIFASRYGVENSDGTFEDNTDSPCPKCGGVGRIPDGSFEFVNGVMVVLEAPYHSREDLLRLASVLKEVDASALTPAQVAEVVEQVGSFGRFAAFLRRPDVAWPVIAGPGWIDLVIHLIEQAAGH